MNRSGNAILFGLLGIGLILLPFMMALLFNAGAEAFFGDKEPMLQTLLGLLVGLFLACCLAVGIPVIGYKGFRKTAWALLVALLALNVLAIPLARWMIRTAYASPTNVIELW
ncbi:MAG: hypothetical protein ABFD16_29160 [Thermoguttaceae bacterium]|jgi:preprotein translocase subunit SecG